MNKAMNEYSQYTINASMLYLNLLEKPVRGMHSYTFVRSSGKLHQSFVLWLCIFLFVRQRKLFP